MDDKDLYAGLIRLHVLHHAVEEGEVYGLWMIEELGRHGYRLSAGTLYPILHGLERKGYLTSSAERAGARARRVYHATPSGAATLATAKARVWELFGELFEPRSPQAIAGGTQRPRTEPATQSLGRGKAGEARGRPSSPSPRSKTKVARKRLP